MPRRAFFKSSAADWPPGAVAASGLTAFDALTRKVQAAGPSTDANDASELASIPDGQPVVLRGGVVLTLDPDVGDFEQADVLIMDKKIVEVRPNLGHVAGARQIDCSGMIVCPGFISTHNHQYEAIQRAMISDGIHRLAGDADQQNTSTTNPAPGSFTRPTGRGTGIWTTGPVWLSGQSAVGYRPSPYDPEDCYNAEAIASLSQLTQGIPAGRHLASSHTPEHTDAMIEGLMAAGADSVRLQHWGHRDTNPAPFASAVWCPDESERFSGSVLAPGSDRDRTDRQPYFTSKDQLITLGIFRRLASSITSRPVYRLRGWQLVAPSALL